MSNGRRDLSRKVAYSAVCTALAIVVVLLSAYTPFRIVPLIFASLAVYIAFVRCGPLYGAVTALASVAVGFFVSGLSATFLFLCIVFVPYALAAFLMRRLTYRVLWQAVVRLAVTVALFTAAAVALVFLADRIVGTSFMTLIDRAGPVLACALVVIAALPVDLFFSYAATRIVGLLK